MQGPSPTRQPATEDTRLVLMCGLPGAGKTTIARRLAERMDAIRLSPDEWLVRLGFDGYDEEARQRIEVLQWELAQEFLFFEKSGSILDERVVEAVGDVRGLRLLHLMCSTGEETLSWANMGARRWVWTSAAPASPLPGRRLEQQRWMSSS